MDHTGNKSSHFLVLSCEHDVFQIKSDRGIKEIYPRASASMEMSAPKSNGMHVHIRERLPVSTELEVEALYLPHSSPECERTYLSDDTRIGGAPSSLVRRGTGPCLPTGPARLQNRLYIIVCQSFKFQCLGLPAKT